MRNLTRRLTTAAFAVIAMTVSAKAAEACSCGVRTCGDLTRADAVFEGTVLSVERTPTLRGTPHADDAELMPGNGMIMVTFKDVKSVLGEAPTVVFTATDEAACGIAFRPGERYLIDAGRASNGQFMTGLCSMTRQIKYAGPLIAYLQAIKAAPNHTRVWGSVGRIAGWPGFNGYRSPIAGAEVTFTGPKRVTVPTDTDGRFVAAGLPQGRYSVTTRVNSKPLPPQEGWSEVLLHKDGDLCAELTISVEPNGGVQGTVVDENDVPARNVHVDLLSADHMLSTGYRPGVSMTLPQGRFVLNDLPPGRYVVAINPRSGPMEHSPYMEAETVPFVVVEGQTAASPTLRARRTTMIEMAGEIRDPDRRPVSSTQLQCRMQLTNTTRPCRVYPDVTTDVEGRFAVRLWKGQRYVISIGPDYAPLASMEFVADGQALMIRARRQ